MGQIWLFLPFFDHFVMLTGPSLNDNLTMEAIGKSEHELQIEVKNDTIVKNIIKFRTKASYKHRDFSLDIFIKYWCK